MFLGTVLCAAHWLAVHTQPLTDVALKLLTPLLYFALGSLVYRHLTASLGA